LPETPRDDSRLGPGPNRLGKPRPGRQTPQATRSLATRRQIGVWPLGVCLRVCLHDSLCARETDAITARIPVDTTQSESSESGRSDHPSRRPGSFCPSRRGTAPGARREFHRHAAAVRATRASRLGRQTLFSVGWRLLRDNGGSRDCRSTLSHISRCSESHVLAELEARLGTLLELLLLESDIMRED
jgi:hypothetical protein